jgi:hypothetical protein
MRHPLELVRSVLTTELPASIAATYVTPRASRQKFSTSQLGAGVFGIYAALHNPAAAISFQDLDDVREVACSMQEGASRPGNAAQVIGSVLNKRASPLLSRIASRVRT